MCVSHVTLAFTRLYIPNGPLKSAKNTTLPHTRRLAGALHLDAGPGPHIARLTRSCLDPSSPKRYVAQVYRPAHDRAGNHVQHSTLSSVVCRATARTEIRESECVKTKSYRWCHLFAKSIFCPYTRIASTASCLSPPPQERVAGRTRVLNGRESLVCVTEVRME